MGLYNRFCKRFFAAVVIRLTAQSDSRAPEGYRSALGLHPMVRYSIAIILYDSSGITLERLEQKRAGKASMKSRIMRSGAALIP